MLVAARLLARKWVTEFTSTTCRSRHSSLSLFSLFSALRSHRSPTFGLGRRSSGWSLCARARFAHREIASRPRERLNVRFVVLPRTCSRTRSWSLLISSPVLHVRRDAEPSLREHISPTSGVPLISVAVARLCGSFPQAPVARSLRKRSPARSNEWLL